MAGARGVDRGGRNARLGLICAAIFGLMVVAAFAAVPLYRAFCQATGFAGAVRRSDAAPTVVSAQTVVVNFDTNVHGVAWKFEPVQRSQVVRLGESKLAFFRVTNTSDKAITGRALYNILPESAGPYFSKLECFCFRNQTVAAGQTVEMPVVYFVDPKWAKDRDATGAGEITLSYTFFPVAPEAEAEASPSNRPSPLGGSPRAGL
jgi:cytochrome c oxidase assembly protein subunit 11